MFRPVHKHRRPAPRNPKILGNRREKHPLETGLRLFPGGGGYVLASLHTIQANVPPENVIVMFDRALSAGVYQ